MVGAQQESQARYTYLHVSWNVLGKERWAACLEQLQRREASLFGGRCFF